ncbi:MAG: hypothetical protein Rpha_0809 [Candidatus Ruthia sp. Apha_13_S6]|nr:hypothetical protein [Candidatus Ruthia sp. Apha_13_S6]
MGDATGAYDAKKGIIQNVVDIELTNRNRLEKSLSFVPFNQGLKFAGGSASGRASTPTVYKPSCDFDNDNDASPTIYVMPSLIASANGEEIISWTSHATDIVGATDS